MPLRALPSKRSYAEARPLVFGEGFFLSSLLARATSGENDTEGPKWHGGERSVSSTRTITYVERRKGTAPPCQFQIASGTGVRRKQPLMCQAFVSCAQGGCATSRGGRGPVPIGPIWHGPLASRSPLSQSPLPCGLVPFRLMVGSSLCGGTFPTCRKSPARWKRAATEAATWH